MRDKHVLHNVIMCFFISGAGGGGKLQYPSCAGLDNVLIHHRIGT